MVEIPQARLWEPDTDWGKGTMEPAHPICKEQQQEFDLNFLKLQKFQVLYQVWD